MVTFEGQPSAAVQCFFTADNIISGETSTP
jgi:hypothetical protein